jgi:hypothetical protein
MHNKVKYNNTVWEAAMLVLLMEWIYKIPTDGVSTLLWWWGLSAPETLRAMPVVA